jgi:hypothetical protein
LVTDQKNIKEQTPAPEHTVTADANGDDLVNVGDAVFIVNYIFREGAAPVPLCSSNANGEPPPLVAIGGAYTSSTMSLGKAWLRSELAARNHLKERWNNKRAPPPAYPIVLLCVILIKLAFIDDLRVFGWPPHNQ